MVIACLIALGIGFTLPVQTNMNVRLGAWTRSPLLASLISFAFSTVLLVIVLLATGLGTGLEGAFGGPVWLWAGGLCGVIFITCNILLLPRLGAVQTVVLPVLGQIVAGIAIDAFGLFDSVQSSLTLWRIAGAILVAGGVILVSVSSDKRVSTARDKSSESVVSSGLDATRVSDASHGSEATRVSDASRRLEATHGSETSRASIWLWRAVAVLIGMLSSIQTAINSHLGSLLGSPLEASVISFAVGTTVLIVIVVVLASCKKLRNVPVKGKASWWMWFGGALGALYVYCCTALAAIIGTGSTVIIMLAGSIAGGVLVDSFGLLGANRKPMTPARTIGLLVLFVGVVLVRFA